MNERGFVWQGERHTYTRGDLPKEPAHSWEYGRYPHLAATITVDDGVRLELLGEGTRWAGDWINFSWVDDEDQTYWSWVPRGDVRQVQDAEWDAHQFSRLPPTLQALRSERQLPRDLRAD